MYYTYILKSEVNGRYYIGHCNDVKSRLIRHNSGYEKATRSNRPWTIVYYEIFSTRSQAVKREYEIKRMKSRSYIEWLISKQ